MAAEANARSNQRPKASSALRHWLVTVNVALGVFLLGGFAAPVLAAVGAQAAAGWLYAAYHYACHQWAFRSFFLFATGPGAAPVAVYDQYQLSATATDPYGFVGNADLGWKMAFCERDLAIYVGLLVVGLLYARRRHMAPLGFGAYVVLVLPMAIDGFTQLFGWRESTWQLRVLTGLLFGLASGWLVLPRLDASFGLESATRQYAPSALCDPPVRSAAEPWINLSPRG